MPHTPSHTRRLAAVMFTDIIGYTALMQESETKAASVRARHRKAFKAFHRQYHGEIVQYFGDGTLSVFSSAVEAVECAMEIQRALNGPDNRIPLRIGLHMGDIVHDGTEIFGDGVNLAARIEGLGVDGAILLSGKLNDEMRNHPGITTRSLGQFALKNINYPVEVFAVTNEGIRVPERSELRGVQKDADKTLAVLPFVNMSSQEENEYFSDGMTEEIINALARIKGLKVTSRTSSFFFKGKQIPLREIGKELNVSTILEGSIRLAGSRMRITAQLVDVEEDTYFWSETFDRSVEDLFAVQDEISLLIADRLREHVGHFDIDDQLVEDPEVPVEVYKDYLKGRYHILKMSPEDIDFGQQLLEKVAGVQPDFALAYLGIHLAFTMKGALGFMSSQEAFELGHPYLEKAIVLNESLPECQLHLSFLSLLQHWDLESTYRHLQASYEIRPTVDYYQAMASTLITERKCDAAMHHIDTALQLDPFSAINYHLKGFIYYVQEQFEEAIIWFEKSFNLAAEFKVSILYLGQALILAGRKEEALAHFRSLPEVEGDVSRLGGMTMTYAALGEIDVAKKGIGELEAALETEHMERALNILILCQALIGDKDNTFQLIGRAIGYRLPLLVYLGVEPILKPFFADPGFQALMDKVLGSQPVAEVPTKTYKQTLLSASQLQEYRERLEQVMEEEAPYLDPELTLRELAQKLDMPANHLSRLLNKGYDKNFSEYVNAYRLEVFKEKAADPANQNLTILALAYESGFNSKTVFNTYFKKMMGMTPSAYWKKVRKG